MKRQSKFAAILVFAVLALVTMVVAAATSWPPEPDLTIERATFDQTKLKVTFYLLNKGVTASSACAITLRIQKAKLETQQSEVVKLTKSVAPLSPGAHLTVAFRRPEVWRVRVWTTGRQGRQRQSST